MTTMTAVQDDGDVVAVAFGHFAEESAQSPVRDTTDSRGGTVVITKKQVGAADTIVRDNELEVTAVLVHVHPVQRPACRGRTAAAMTREMEEDRVAFSYAVIVDEVGEEGVYDACASCLLILEGDNVIFGYPEINAQILIDVLEVLNRTDDRFDWIFAAKPSPGLKLFN